MNNTLTIKIEGMDNAAFVDNPSEVSDILRRLADRISEAGGWNNFDGTKVLDSNGQTVGRIY